MSTETKKRERKTAHERFKEIHPELVKICEMWERECIEKKNYTGAQEASDLKIKILKNGHDFNMGDFEAMFEEGEGNGN